MLGDNNHPTLPVYFDDNNIQYEPNASNQLQLFGNVTARCTADPVNYFGNEQLAPMIWANKRARETDNSQRQQKPQVSLNYNPCQDKLDPLTTIPKQNLVSTGLRLSYDDDERNSSVTSASGTFSTIPGKVLSLGDTVKMELDRQNEEFNKYIKLQTENLAKGVRDMRQKHLMSFLGTLEKGISKKLQEKDREIESMNRKNQELVEKIKQVAAEAQSWHYRAKYNESVVNVLKGNLQQAISQGGDQGKEGFGDSEIDDATSYADTNHYLNVAGRHGRCFSHDPRGTREGNARSCKACNVKEVEMLLVPCRHLCLCRDCDALVSACPVCQMVKTSSVQVFFS